MQSFTLRYTQRLANRVHAANQRHHDGDGSDENRDAPVGMQIKGEWKTEVGHQDVNSTGNPDAGSPTGEGTGKCKHPRLDKDLRRNARRFGAESGTDGDFAAAACGVLAQQRCNIDADQHHQQAGSAQKDRQALHRLRRRILAGYAHESYRFRSQLLN